LASQFYAVTIDSLYLAKSKKDSHGSPVFVDLLAKKRFTEGKFIGIAREGISLYRTQGGLRRPDPYAVRREDVKKRTSPVIALFFEKEKARECFHLFKSTGCRKKEQWRRETEIVLMEIGSDHEVFVLSRLNPVLP